jgi:hypothetical protein
VCPFIQLAEPFLDVSIAQISHVIFFAFAGKSLPFSRFVQNPCTKDDIATDLAGRLVLAEHVIGWIFSFDHCNLDTAEAHGHLDRMDLERLTANVPESLNKCLSRIKQLTCQLTAFVPLLTLGSIRPIKILAK